MPILSTDQYGSGTLFTMTAGDPFALLKAGVDYVSTGTSPTMAIPSTIGNSALTIAGGVESARGIAISVNGPTTGFRTHDVTVRETGTVIAQNVAISVVNADTTIVNAGTISGSSAISLTDTGNSVFFASIINSGTMIGTAGTAVFGGDISMSMRNTGTIIGAVRLGNGGSSIVNTGTIAGLLSGGSGGDELDTHAGRVTGTVSGGSGSDTYIIAGTERLFEFSEQGTDTVQSFGDYRLAVNIENLILLGTARLGYGNLGNNRLTANDQGNSLFGLGGDDVIRGGVGDDVLNGGIGDDQITLTAGQDVIAGGAGIDQLTVDLAGDYTIDLTARTATGTVIDTAQITGIEDVRIVSSGNDTIIGSQVANRLDGGAGNDFLFGGAGDDTLLAGTGDDTFDGGSGIDLLTFAGFSIPITLNLTLGTSVGDFQGSDVIIDIENVIGTSGADSLTGSALANQLDGAFGADVLSGLGGNDILVGGAGDDTLTGGGARDTFLFAAESGTSGTDTITDFQDTFDKISFVGGVNAINSLADIAITADPGAGTVTLVSDEGTIILQGLTLANIDASDFIFDPVAPLAAPLMVFDRALYEPGVAIV